MDLRGRYIHIAAKTVPSGSHLMVHVFMDGNHVAKRYRIEDILSGLALQELFHHLITEAKTED